MQQLPVASALIWLAISYRPHDRSSMSITAVVDPETLMWTEATAKEPCRILRLAAIIGVPSGLNLAATHGQSNTYVTLTR